MLALYGTAMAGTLLVEPKMLRLNLMPHGVTDYYRDFQAINVGLLGAQAALVALIYPLVIALVGVLFEARTTTGGRLNVFLSETEAVASGGSALLLCAVIAFQLPLSAQLPVRMVAVATLLNTAWLVLNVWGTGFFVVRAFDFIRPQTRTDLVRRYTTNVAWRVELEVLVTANRFLHAVEYGYLPGGRRGPPAGGGEFSAVRTVAVSVSPWMPDTVEDTVKALLDDASVLADVRLPVLAVVARAWLRSASESTPAAHSGFGGGPHLIFRYLGGQLDSGLCILAVTSGGYGLDWAQRTLVRLAYRFRRSPGRRTPPWSASARLLREVVSELIPLVEAGRLEEFSTQLDQVIDLHAFLFQVATAPGSPSPLSYAQMRSLTGFGHVGDEWARAYFDLIKRAVARLPQTPEFFGNCAFLASNLYGAAARHGVSPAALSSLHSIARFVFWGLREWAVATYRAETGRSGGPGAAFELAPVGAEVYGRAWRDLVAGWDRLGDAFRAELPDEPDRAWSALGASFEPLWAHLEGSAVMVAASAFAGDLLATRWSTDTLLKWYNASADRWNKHWTGLPIEDALADPVMLKESWAEITVQPRIAALAAAGLGPVDAFAGVIENAWSDTQVLLLCVLGRWATASNISGTAMVAARGILRREFYDRDARTDDRRELFSLSSFVEAITRMTCLSDFGQREGWDASISGLLYQLGQVLDQPRVSGRIYTSTLSFHHVSEFATEQAAYLVALAAQDRSPSERLKRALAAVTARDDAAARRLLQHLAKLTAAVASLNSVQHGPFVAALRGAPDHAGFEDGRTCASEVLNACIAVVDAARVARVRSAPIDREYLSVIAAAAGATAFTKETADSPIALFEEVALVHELLEPFTFGLVIDRGTATAPRMADPISGEVEWWRDKVRRDASILVFQDVVRIAPTVEVRGETADRYWSVVKAGADAITASGDRPLLLVSENADPPWLKDWMQQWPGQELADLPDGLRVWRARPKPGPRYVFNLNEIAVHAVPIADLGCSYLLPAGLLRRVEFTEFAPACTARAEFEDDPDDPWKGNLKVTFARHVQLGSGLLTRIVTGIAAP